MAECGADNYSIGIHEDNINACIKVVNKPIQHQRMKHLGVKYSFLYEHNVKNVISLRS